jgi:hypothetical protein
MTSFAAILAISTSAFSITLLGLLLLRAQKVRAVEVKRLRKH